MYALSGWQTFEDEMRREREKFSTFLNQNGVAARSCLCHASRIFSMLRSARYFHCYDALSLCVAINYISAYIQTAVQPASGEVVRLDRAGSRIESWTKEGGNVRLHLTGVGILGGPQSTVRLLADTIKTLQSQAAWRGLSRALAACFAQTLRGERLLRQPE